MQKGNYWTVFKGLPEPGESPHQTALREFAEETGSNNVLVAIDQSFPILKGRTSAKDLEIFLQDGSNVSESIFNPDQVVTIDSGYLQGQPEIVAIRYLSLEEALSGSSDGAKIYKSQEGILKQAEAFLTTRVTLASSG